MDHLLSGVVWLPLCGGAALLLLPGRWRGLLKGAALSAGLVECLMVLALCLRFDPAEGVQFAERYEWVPALGIYFDVGLDGLSLPLLAMTSLLLPLSLLASWRAPADRFRGRASAALFASAATSGMLAARDLALFYFFFEFSILPFLFLICGGGENGRGRAAVRFGLQALAGSLPLLLALLYLNAAHLEVSGRPGFGASDLASLSLPLPVRQGLFAAFFVGFAVRMPLVPLHLWLGEVQERSPVSGAVLVAGAWSTVGGYGLLRFCLGIFPEAFASFQGPLAALALLSLFYGALLSLAQTEPRRMVACLEIAQAGLVLLGACALNPQGVEGSLLLILCRGLAAPALFLILGLRTGPDREAAGGSALPALLLLGFGLALAGLPGLGGFAGVLLVLSGAVRSFGPSVLAASIGLVLAGGGALRLFRSAGREREGGMGGRAAFLLAPLALGIVALGLYPSPLLRSVERPAETLLARALVEPEKSPSGLEGEEGDRGGKRSPDAGGAPEKEGRDGG